MYAGNDVSVASTLSKGNGGLKIAVNFKAGAAASNPSLLNTEPRIFGNLRLNSHRIVGIKPCTNYFYCTR